MTMIRAHTYSLSQKSKTTSYDVQDLAQFGLRLLSHIGAVVRPSEHYSSLSNREKWRHSAPSANVVLRRAP